MYLANLWKQSGHISLWRYTENERNYPGWHLNADHAGCHSLQELVEALAAVGGGSRSVTLTAPTKSQLGVPNNHSGRAAWLAPSKLRVAYSATPSEWSFPAGIEPAVLTIGSDWLSPLLEGIAGIPKGRGDYCIGGQGSENLPLWFWW